MGGPLFSREICSPREGQTPFSTRIQDVEAHGRAGTATKTGGGGADTLDSGTGDDVLLAALLSYFDEGTGAADTSALAALRAEWSRTDLNYAGRIAHLQNGGGLNGSYVLNTTTVLDDGGVYTLFGRGALDWFLVGVGDMIQDLNTGGTETVAMI